MNLNDRDWAEFKVSDLFNVKYGVNLELNACIESDKTEIDSVNFVARTAENNGISARVMTIDGVEPQKKGLISVAGGGSVLSTFLQNEPFYSGRDLYTLDSKDNISDEAKMFIITIIEQNKYKYSYGRQANKTLPDLLLKLPINDNGEPDYIFMENYIKSLHHKPLTTKNKSGQAPDLNVQDWGEFCLGELFDVSKAYAYNQETFEPIEDVNVNKIGCITRTANNNGLDYYGELTSDLKIETGNALTIGGEGVVCFYQPEQFVCGTNMTVLRHKNLNKYNGLFISRVIDYYSKDRFSYGRAFNKGQVEKSIIKLPVDINGEPDWQFMEDYIKALPYGDRLEG